MGKTKTKHVLRFRTLRRSREMTQRELAKRIGLDTSAVSAIEKGKRKPSVDAAIAMADLFEVPVQALFELVEVPA